MQTSGSKPSAVPQIIGGLGALLLIVGSFMTWVTVSLSIDKFAQLLGIDPGLISGSGVDTTTTVAGTEGDGKITLVLGLVAIVGVTLIVAVATARKAGAAMLLVGGVAGALLCLWEVTTKNRQIDDALNQSSAILSQLGVSADQFKDVFSVSWGIGLWTCLVGGLVAAVGGIMALMSRASAEPQMAGGAAVTGSGFDLPATAPPAPSAPTEPPPAPSAPAEAAPPAAPAMPEAGTSGSMSESTAESMPAPAPAEPEPPASIAESAPPAPAPPTDATSEPEPAPEPEAPSDTTVGDEPDGTTT